MTTFKTYNIVIETLRAFADGHFQLRQFTHGQIDLMNMPKETEYPLMHVVPVDFTLNKGDCVYNFDITFADLPRDKEDKPEYQRESISDMAQIAADLVYEVESNKVLFGQYVDLIGSPTITPFMEEFTQVLTGVVLSIQIQVPNDWNGCIIPADYSSGSGSASSGGITTLVFSESLNLDGNVVTLDNDVESPGNSYYYGTNASGVKGWYPITGGGGGSGTVTSVALSMPSAFSVSGSPITSSGTFTVTGAGTTSQYIRGDGSLATFPDIPGGTVESVSGDSVDNTDPDNPVVNAWPLAGTGSDVATGTIEIDGSIVDIDIIKQFSSSLAGGHVALFFGDGTIALQGSDGSVTTEMTIAPGVIGAASQSVGFQGITYGQDYSDNFTASSLVDKQYVDAQVVDTSITAKLDKSYVVVANATFTDPTPAEGKGFVVFVRNGTATVGGTGYSTAGTLIYRIYHSGAWANYTIGGSGSGITQLTGDVTAGPGSGSQAATIANDAVTYAKMQNVSAASRLLGRGAGLGAGDVEEITLGSGLSMSSNTLNGNTGTVTSVALSTPSEFTVSGSPVTSSGTLTFTKANQNANIVYAGPSSGAAAAPTFRALVVDDIPSSIPRQDSTFLAQGHGNTTTAAGGTNYGAIYGGANTLSATEAPRESIVPVSGTLSRFYVRTSNSQPGTGSYVFTVRINGVNTGITLTIAAGSAGGTFSDLTNTASVNAGDRITFSAVNNASGSSAQLLTTTLVLTR